MRKWISFLLAGALMIGCLPTLADKPAKKVSYYLDADGKVNLYISLGTDAYGEVMLNVFEKDFDISTFSGLADDETNGYIAYVKELCFFCIRYFFRQVLMYLLCHLRNN